MPAFDEQMVEQADGQPECDVLIVRVAGGYDHGVLAVRHRAEVLDVVAGAARHTRLQEHGRRCTRRIVEYAHGLPGPSIAICQRVERCHVWSWSARTTHHHVGGKGARGRKDDRHAACALAALIAGGRTVVVVIHGDLDKASSTPSSRPRSNLACCDHKEAGDGEQHEARAACPL